MLLECRGGGTESAKKFFFDFLKVNNELGKVKKFGTSRSLFHGEIAIWKKCGLIQPPHPNRVKILKIFYKVWENFPLGSPTSLCFVERSSHFSSLGSSNKSEKLCGFDGELFRGRLRNDAETKSFTLHHHLLPAFRTLIWFLAKFGRLAQNLTRFGDQFKLKSLHFRIKNLPWS